MVGLLELSAGTTQSAALRKTAAGVVALGDLFVFCHAARIRFFSSYTSHPEEVEFSAFTMPWCVAEAVVMAFIFFSAKDGV